MSMIEWNSMTVQCSDQLDCTRMDQSQRSHYNAFAFGVLPSNSNHVI